MKRWNFASFLLAAVVVYGLGKWYRPLLGVRVGALVDIVAFIGLFAGCRYALRKTTEGLDD